MNFKNWTESFAQSILSSSLQAEENHIDLFLNKKLRNSVASLEEASSMIHSCHTPREFYSYLCVFIQEAKNCMYWYERSLEYEKVNLNNSHLIINQGKSMIEVLEATLRVIKFQESSLN
ncbi:MAG: hypothetical protein U0X76_01965 [Bacteroidia bacterium]